MEGGGTPVQQCLAGLINLLERKRDSGARAVWLSPKARKDLRVLPELGWAGVPAEIEGRQEEAAEGQEAKVGLRVRERGDREEGGGAVGGLQPEGETAEERLAWLRTKAENWGPARELDSLREKMVFAVGNPRAELMLVGEAPGAEEERKGEPFVGPAGEKLTEILRAMKLERSEVYITNIVKCRPAMPNQGQSNRAPTAEEIAAYLPFVKAEIEIVSPKVIVALGASAARGLLGREEAVGRMRGRFWEFEGVPVMVTFHPAYLLHQNAGKEEKRKVWEDMLQVMERLGRPITEKQRGFFR